MTAKQHNAEMAKLPGGRSGGRPRQRGHHRSAVDGSGPLGAPSGHARRAAADRTDGGANPSPNVTCCMYVRAGRPRARNRVHNPTSG